MEQPYVIGLDLGALRDYTALALLERVGLSEEFPSGGLVRHLERFPRGTPYPEIVAAVRGMLAYEPLCPRFRQARGHGALARSPAPLVVDNTGVGQAVVDMMFAEGLRPIRVTIHGGLAERCTGQYQYYVPKRDLLTGLLIAFQQGSLLLAPELETTEHLQEELQCVTHRLIAESGGAFDHTPGANDGHADLVMALALAYWYAMGRYAVSAPRTIVPAGV